MILIRPAAEPATGDDPRLSVDWTGTEVLLSAAADPDQYRAAIAAAARLRLPLVITQVSREDLGRVVIRIARSAPDMGLAAAVLTHGWEPCIARATFTPLTLRQRLRPARRGRRPRPDGDGVFRHAVSLAKEDRAERLKLATAAEALTEAGITVIDGPGYDSPARDLHRLTDDGQPVDLDDHRSCPGHAAYVSIAWNGQIATDLVCTDPAANGHADRWAGRGSSSPPPGAPGLH